MVCSSAVLSAYVQQKQGTNLMAIVANPLYRPRYIDSVGLIVLLLLLLMLVLLLLLP